MSGVVVSGPAAQMVAAWRKRRRELVAKHFPPDAQKEFKMLGMAIKAATEYGQSFEHMLAAGADDFPVGEPCEPIQPTPRVPMSVHRRKLVDYLSAYGHGTRAKIIAKTGIPPGSLSELLRDHQFVQKSRGVWALRDPNDVSGGSDDQQPLADPGSADAPPANDDDLFVEPPPAPTKQLSADPFED